MTRSILGRAIVVVVLVSSLAVIGHAALLWTGGKGAKHAPPGAPETVAAGAEDAAPIRVVYPGPGTAADVSTHKVVGQIPPGTPFPDPPAPIPSDLKPAAGQVASLNAVTPLPPTATLADPPPASLPPRPVADTKTAALPTAADPRSKADAAPKVAEKGSAGALNINSASVEALDRLPGGGHIGQSIARHRPYASIEDLVRKRVLRRSVYDKIKDQIATE